MSCFDCDHNLDLARQALIHAIDTADRGLHTLPGDDPHTTGFNMLREELFRQLENLGLSVAPVEIGMEFDPHLHEAIELVAGEEGKIVDIVRIGWQIQEGEVIKNVRVTQVTVGSEKLQKEELVKGRRKHGKVASPMALPQQNKRRRPRR